VQLTTSQRRFEDTGESRSLRKLKAEILGEGSVSYRVS